MAEPKIGERISVNKFHVSKMNVRAEEPFGESEEDKSLITNLRQGRIIGPFKARPEGKGYGVFVGRRRFLAKKRTTKHFVIGTDCIIETISDEDAREFSLIENLEVLRKDMNPVTRAEQLNQIIFTTGVGVRGTAARLGISPSTLSEWLKILELTPKMRKTLKEGLILYTDALKLVRMELGTDLQDKLAEVLETEGIDAFNLEVAKIPTDKIKRGIPKGVYVILRTTFDKRYKPDVEAYDKLTKLAEAKKMKIDEYCKWVLTEHAKSSISNSKKVR